MNIEGMTPILTSVGFGMVSGFLIGFAIKKVMKVPFVLPLPQTYPVHSRSL